VSNDWLKQYAADGNLKGIILSGSHASLWEDETLRAPSLAFELGIPVLGICFGMYAIAAALGGKVEGGHKREFGYAELRARGHTKLFDGIQDYVTAEGHGMLHVWMSHGDNVTEMPPGFKLMASTDSCPIAGMADEERKFYAVQFHPEVTHTTQGQAILNRFVLDICGAKHEWIMKDYIANAVAKIREQVGSEQVILGLSGGVDSSVAAALIHRAIGDQLTCVFVDHGLLRLNEGQMVMDMFVGKLHAKVIAVDASDQFMGHLKGVSDPEQKRKIIGREFVEVFKAEAAKLSNAKWLAQGTIYPDVIESGGAKTKKAVTIKSHHNVGGLPEQLGLKLLEPLRDLFKDEVRELGIELGLPHEMVYRHPFPGPGLGVRILGEVKKEYADLLRRADAIFIEELRNTPFVSPPLQGSDTRQSAGSPPPLQGEAGTQVPRGDGVAGNAVRPESVEGQRKSNTPKTWYDATSQAFAVFLPVKSVGVMGDGRTYDYVGALRAVQTSDFMTADWAELPYGLLKRVSNRIINEVRGINRVTLDVSSKPPATIEWE
jgi:GMP synthase (glutamine-hydrolysing)